jgi:hypothetical protein
MQTRTFVGWDIASLRCLSLIRLANTQNANRYESDSEDGEIGEVDSADIRHSTSSLDILELPRYHYIDSDALLHHEYLASFHFSTTHGGHDERISGTWRSS